MLFSVSVVFLSFSQLFIDCIFHYENLFAMQSQPGTKKVVRPSRNTELLECKYSYCQKPVTVLFQLLLLSVGRI